MPELPEAETIARLLDARLRGERTKKVARLRPDIVVGDARTLRRWLRDSRIEGVRRRAKRVIIDLDHGHSLIFYLGMTGRLEVAEAAAPPAPHTHLRLVLADGRGELRFVDARRFGRIHFFDRNEGGVPEGLADLGPEPLEISAADFRGLVGRRRQIKALLLDQSAIAGLGNIYCDEVLYRAGIHPSEVAADVDRPRVDRLYRAVRAVLREAIRCQGTTIINYAHPDGPGGFQRRLRVYGRQGEPCRVCGTPLQRVIAAGRATHFCPVCQPERSTARRQ